MAVTDGGRPALTRYRVVERFRAHTLLRDRARDGAHASDPRAHGAHPRAVARRPRLRRPAEAAAPRRATSCAPRCKVSAPSVARERGCVSRTPTTGAALEFREPARARSRARARAACAPTRPGARDERAFRVRAGLARAAERARLGHGARRSAARYGTLNLATARRRRRQTPSRPIAAACARRSRLPAEPRWLEQVHGARVLDLDREQRAACRRCRHGPRGRRVRAC